MTLLLSPDTLTRQWKKNPYQWEKLYLLICTDCDSWQKIVTYFCSFKIIRQDALAIICNYNHCFTIFPLHCWRECTPLVCWMDCFQILCKLLLFSCISWKIRMSQTAVTICWFPLFYIGFSKVMGGGWHIHLSLSSILLLQQFKYNTRTVRTDPPSTGSAKNYNDDLAFPPK